MNAQVCLKYVKIRWKAILKSIKIVKNSKNKKSKNSARNNI